MIRNLIWDVDGTLLDTYPAMTRAFCAALEQLGQTVEPERVAALAGVSLGHCARTLAEECGLAAEELLQRFNSCYRVIPLGEQGPFPGAVELCEHALASGGLNVIITHRGRESLLRLLAAHGLSRYFAGLIAADDGFPRKPDPAAFHEIIARHGLTPAETLAIGDREIDVLAAQAAGVRACLFAPLPQQTAADYAVSDLRQLQPILQAQPYTLRPLTAADEPFLWEMLYQAIHVSAGAAPPPREIIRQPELACYVRSWGRDGDMGFVAVEAATQTPVGAAWLRLWPGAERGYGYVDGHTPELSVAILPGYRGQGLGTRLLQKLLAVADERFAAVSLSVSRDNPAAGLYVRLGFAVVAEEGESLTMVRSRPAGWESNRG